MHTIRPTPVLFALGAACLLPASAPAIEIEYDSNLRYRYELFSRDQDATTPANADSKASTLRLGVTLNAKLGNGFGGLVEIESVHQIGEDDYNIPTIPSQAIPGYPVIGDPEGTEMNQAYMSWQGPMNTVVKLGRQEIKLNEGRFISNSGWRQNHQSFNAASLSSAPFERFNLELGHLTRVYRVVGDDASNGRTDLSGNYFNLAYTLPDVGVIKAYGVLLDFDSELSNSTDTFGVRFEGNLPLASSGLRLLTTLDFARQKDAGDNPNPVSASYRLIEIGVKARGLDFIAGQALLEGASATDKFNTPLAHPFNGFTELFLNTPSLGASHGLDARYLRISGPVPGVAGLTATAAYYDYQPETGSADYGSELDFDLAWKATPLAKNLVLGWRFGKYASDGLFSDALRTSVWAGYTF